MSLYCDHETGNTAHDQRLTLFPKMDYGSTETDFANEQELLLGKPNLLPSNVERELAELIYHLFMHHHHHSHNHPQSSPQLPPERRGRRHRNFYVSQLNEFRHWWKTSRLLVRISGAFTYCVSKMEWQRMAHWNVARSHHSRRAFKQMKTIGQGGASRLFLKQVMQFTRTLRIVIAIARAWEARVDNRLYEVGLAEAFAFVGNRCFRYWTRQLTDFVTVYILFPISAVWIAPYIDQRSRPIIITMGLLRSILPFTMSFQGSRFGRQVTLSAYRSASYCWKPTMSIMHFHERAGTYRDLDLDPQLHALARQIAEAIGHGASSVDVRNGLEAIGFINYGSGKGGYSVFRMIDEIDRRITLHLTPIGPSILDEMPRFILLERRSHFYWNHIKDEAVATMLDSATPRESKVRGFTYSGAFFQSQEWAALQSRYAKEMADYASACRQMGTLKLSVHKRNPHSAKSPSPPNDLASLKTFIRSGRQAFHQWRDDKRWKQMQVEVKRMAKLVKQYQREGKAPNRVILYLEGLDCAGKSSTGKVICDALEHCGFSVATAQHNKPPTPEQLLRPWMDRGRFEYPDDMSPDGPCPEYAALVWDRGPIGDFIYGFLSRASLDEKMEKYREFREYDCKCREDDVLFFKCFYVTDRDSIASTLGKRLAHKQIVKDLRTWLDANSLPHYREGLEEIERHIDPTDFVAFNRYEENLAKFSDVVRNTDIVGRVGHQTQGPVNYHNHWLVINTSDRHAARLSMMKAFRHHLDMFAAYPGRPRNTAWRRLLNCFRKEKDDIYDDSERVPNDIVDRTEYGLPIRVVWQAFLLFLLFYAYSYKTWDFSFEDIT